MCLRIVKSFKPTEKNIGYKWVIKSENKYWSVNNGRFNYYKKEWSIAENNGQDEKDFGFHIFDRYDEAIKSKWGKVDIGVYNNGGRIILLKVRYEDYHTGYGDGLGDDDKRMIVAKKMKVIEELK